MYVADIRQHFVNELHVAQIYNVWSFSSGGRVVTYLWIISYDTLALSHHPGTYKALFSGGGGRCCGCVPGAGRNLSASACVIDFGNNLVHACQEMFLASSM